MSFNDSVEVWYGDGLIGVMLYDEFLDLFEEDPWYWCRCVD